MSKIVQKSFVLPNGIFVKKGTPLPSSFASEYQKNLYLRAAGVSPSLKKKEEEKKDDSRKTGGRGLGKD